MLFKISIKYYITIIFSLISFVKRYAVRNVKIRQYAVRRVKIRQYARGRGVSPSVIRVIFLVFVLIRFLESFAYLLNKLPFCNKNMKIIHRRMQHKLQQTYYGMN